MILLKLHVANVSVMFNEYQFMIFRRDADIYIARISYGNVAGWLTGCHSRRILSKRLINLS